MSKIYRIGTYYALPRRRAQSQTTPATIKLHRYSRKYSRKAPTKEKKPKMPKLGNHGDNRLNHAPNDHTGTNIRRCTTSGGLKSVGADIIPALTTSNTVHQ
jgi:hypothetical protein